MPVRRLDRFLQSDRDFNRFVLSLTVASFLLLVVAGGAATLLVQRNQAQSRWVAHTYEVERALFEFRLLFERTETTRRGFMLSREPIFAAAYDKAAREAPGALAKVARLTVDNPRQQRAVETARDLLAAQLARTDTSVEDVRAGRAALAIANFPIDGSFPVIRRLREQTDTMIAEENRLLAIRDAEQAGSARALFIVIGLAAALLVLTAALGFAAIRRYVRQLNRSQAALRGLNENLEGAVRERTADLQRANDEIQRFAYIVSHDLRSPLVNVMGFTAELETATAELGRLIDRAEAEAPQIVSADARLAAREDLPEAIRFIRSSTQKMDRLINAILRLSREGRRVLTPERLDMAALIENIRASMTQVIDAAGATLAVPAPLPVIVSDRLAIEQIFSNLIENAVKYLKDGRAGTVTVRGRQEKGMMVFEVADNGRGIDPRDHERVFDLFRRSGTQDRPGEGIGLAHVRALVYRLGGTIGCDSALDKGAAFRVTLPPSIASEGDVRP